METGHPVLYRNAPVVEAIIDVHVSYESQPSIEQFEQYSKSIRERFSSIQRMDEIEMAFLPGKQEPSEPRRSPTGVRLASTANDRVLQLRSKGFTYSHLPRYTNWETFSAECRAAFENFVREFPISGITRTAVRFINKIETPSDIDVADYLHLHPKIPEAVAPEAGGYFLQLMSRHKDVDPACIAIVNSGIQAGHTPDKMALLLDIDVFVQRAMSEDMETLFKLLDSLRHKKNKIFEASITDKVREVIA